MTRYIVSVSDRNYSEWSVKYEGCEENREVIMSICPSSEKLFSGDIFSTENDTTIQLHYSPTRELDKIPGGFATTMC